MKVIFLSKFSKDLDKITDTRIRKAIKKAIIKIEKAPSTKKLTSIKKLKGEAYAYRLRVGQYRIGMYIEDQTVELARVAHRKKIYDIFP
ncbi:MAG TPA: type II toxin-antitoxin system RelE/ParE family toxin [Balneolaceae bacterium]|nr:type II toxin-antitoxin system RelE/ParE family toxin [Balneolaceae bacterium]